MLPITTPACAWAQTLIGFIGSHWLGLGLGQDLHLVSLVSLVFIGFMCFHVFSLVFTGFTACHWLALVFTGFTGFHRFSVSLVSLMFIGFYWFQ